MGDNQLELEVQLKLELENDFDDAIFKKIESAANRAKSRIKKIFKDINLLDLSLDLANLVGITNRWRVSLNSTLKIFKEITKELQKQEALVRKISSAGSTDSDFNEQYKDSSKNMKEEFTTALSVIEDSGNKLANSFKNNFNAIATSARGMSNTIKSNIIDADYYEITPVSSRFQQTFDSIKAAGAKLANNLKNNFSGISAAFIIAVRAMYKAFEKFMNTTIKMTTTLVTSFGKVTAAITSFAVKLSGLPIILRGINSALSTLNNSILSTFTNLTSRISFSDIIKQSVELSSSLTEVKNVIDNVFGDSAKEIYAFTSNAVKQLGMSTLAAQEFAGRFGAALRSTGQSAKDVTALSKSLTQLTSDIASFYDIEQSVAAEKLFSGVISGTIKPMRELGVDMTKASLQAWMLAKGYDATYKSLSAAQQQMIRYEYVMEKLNYVHGDYARTINSTANQIRLLKNQLKELGSVVGAIINAFFNPFIQVLNRVVASITNVAKSIAGILGIDWTLGTGSGVAGLGGVADSYDDLADSADDLSDAEDGVAKSTDKAAKAAKKALAPFHKLNVLQNKQAEDANKSSKGAGSGLNNLFDMSGVADAAAAKIPTIQELLSRLKKALKDAYDKLMKLDWEKIGRNIAKALNNIIKQLPGLIKKVLGLLNELWKKILKGIDGFIDELDTYDIGAAIGELIKGIGDLIYSALTEINYQRLGEKFGELINGIFKVEGLGDTIGGIIGAAIQDGFEFILGVVRTTDWVQIGKTLYESLAAALREIDPKTIHDALFEGLTNITTALNEFFTNLENDEESKKKIRDCLSAVISAGAEYLKSSGFAELVGHIATFISGALEALKTELDKPENKEAIGEALDILFAGIGEVLKSGEDLAASVWEYVKLALKKFFTNNKIPLPFKILGAVEIANLVGVTDIAEALIKGIILAKLMGLTVPLGTIAATVGVIVAGVAVIYAEWKILSKAVTDLTGLAPSFEQFFKSIVNYLKICYGIIAGIDGAIKSFMGYGLASLLEILGEILGKIPGIGTGLQDACNKGSQALKGLVDNMNENHQKTMDSLTTMSNKWGDFGKSIDDAKGKVGSFGEQVGTSMDDAEKSLSKIPIKIHEVDGEIRNAASESKKSVDSEWAKEITAAGIDNLSSKFSTEYGNIDKDTKDAVSTINTDLGSIGGDDVDWEGLYNKYLTTYMDGLESATSTGVTNINTELGTIGSTLTSESFNGVNAAFNEGFIVPIQTSVGNLGLDIQKAFSEALIAVEGIWTPFSAWWGESVTNLVLGNVATFNSLLSTANTTEYAAITGIWQPLPSYIQTDVLTILDGYISPWLSTLESTNNEYYGKLTDIWKALPDYIKTNVTEKVIELIQKLFEQAEKDTNEGIKEMKNAWDDLYKHIDGVVKDISSRLDDLISKAKEAATEIANAASASNSINTSSNSSSSIPGYASGGVFYPNRPQLAILGDNKSQMEYALTTGHLKQIADMMSNVIGSSGFEGNITIPIYVDGVLSAKKVITASQMHNYRSNGR